MKLKISRKANLYLNYIINDIAPPFLRDFKWFMLPAFKILFGKKYPLFFNFHDNVYNLSDEEFARLNSDIQDVIIQRKTDLNEECINQIQLDAVGEILEVGAGGGYLAELLSNNHNVTAIDVAIDKNRINTNTKVKYIEASSENIPFEDKSFETVICTHTLEHVRDINKTLHELRRLAKSRLIIVVPCERPYRYTFNLHIHFFPYQFSLQSVLGVGENKSIKKLGGDWYYIEKL